MMQSLKRESPIITTRVYTWAKFYKLGGRAISSTELKIKGQFFRIGSSFASWKLANEIIKEYSKKDIFSFGFFDPSKTFVTIVYSIPHPNFSLKLDLETNLILKRAPQQTLNNKQSEKNQFIPNSSSTNISSSQPQNLQYRGRRY